MHISWFFFVSSISYRPTDLSLIKYFSKNVIFSNSYDLPSQSAIQKLSISTLYPKFYPACIWTRKFFIEVFPSQVASKYRKGRWNVKNLARGQTSVLWVFYLIYNSYQNFIGTSSHVGSYTFRRPCTGLRQAKPGQSGLDELSPACAATPAPPARRTHSAKRYPGETCAEVKARARLDNVRGAELNATPACAAPCCLDCLRLPVPRACATAPPRETTCEILFTCARSWTVLFSW